MDTINLPGPVKVAILLQSFDDKARENVLKSLSDTQRATIQGHLSQMGEMAAPLVEKVAREFTAMANRISCKQESNAFGSTQRVGSGNRSAPRSADEKHPTQQASESPNLKVIQSLEPKQLLELVKYEHPQTIATILTHSKTEAASEVLSLLPDKIKGNVALRIANLDTVSPGVVEEIGKVFEEVLNNRETVSTQNIGGAGRLAEILIQLDGSTSEMILGEIEETDPELATQVKKKMFVFDDLRLVDDKGFQMVLRKIETRELAMALKAASEEVRTKVLKNLSARAGEMLGEEIEELGPVRMKDVEHAQQEIIRVVQDMATKGEIAIRGRGGEEFIV